jgi:hypothetical protein
VLWKAICFIGSVLAIGLTWFFAALALAETAFSVELEGPVLWAVGMACAVFAAYPSWKLFIAKRSRYVSE